MGDPGTIAVKAALTAASMALTMSQKIEGPRLDSLDVTTADYGTPIPYIWGRRRLEGCPIIWAEKLREKKTTSKTKGGKYAEYKYFGTFAVLVAGHEINSVSRIWMDKHLVYDAVSAGPISPFAGLFQGLQGSPVKITQGRNMRIYLGTEDQEPDRRMESWCEDRYGPDSCPAYKGTAYIVFEELPLEKFGNRIPQITVEAIRVDTNAFPVESANTDSEGNGIQFNADFSRFYYAGEVWDTATRTRLYDHDFLPPYSLAFMDNGDFFIVDGFPSQTLYRSNPDGFLTEITGVTFESYAGHAYYVGGQTCFTSWGGVLNEGLYLDGLEAIRQIDLPAPAHHFFINGDATPLVICGGTGECYIGEFPFGTMSTVTTGKSGEAYAYDPGGNDYFVSHGDTLFLVDKATFTVTASLLNPFPSDQEIYFRNIRQGTPTIWFKWAEIDALNLEEIRTVNPLDWTAAATGVAIYDPINHALVCHTTGSDLYWRFLDRVASDGATLADVVSDVAEMCGAEVDVSDLDQIVQGYSVTQGSGKDMVAPLLDIHDVDARPHDFTLQFIKRGQASQGSITQTEFVREGDEARYQITIKQDEDIPRRISLSFADKDKDQQTNTVISQRPLDAADTVRVQQIDMTTYVWTPGDAQKALDRYFRRQWNEREEINLVLTGQYMGAEPGDTFDLTLDGVSRYARLKKTTFSQGRINTEWVRDALSFNTLSSGAGAELDARDEDEVYVPSPTKGIVLDIPLVRDSHNHINPLLYYGAGGYTTASWPGAVIYERDYNEDEYFEWNGVDSSDKATWGYATDVLGGATPALWDNVSSVNISVNGTLTSVTQAAVDANPLLNLAYIGDQTGQGELINFTTATLEGDGTYTLSGFKRGRRGTEWAIESHAIGDLFVLISDLNYDARGLDDIGSELGFKVQSLGRALEGAPTIELDYTAASLKPYAPAHFEAVKDSGTGDWDFTWIRRTRIGGNWGGGSSIPLGETSESYKVKIYDGDTVVRTITSTSESATYTAAQQTTDFGGTQSTIIAGVLQVADAVDGFEAGLEIGAPSVRGLGSLESTNALSGVTPTLPDDTAVSDILLLAVETDSGDTIAAPAGYELVGTQAGSSAKLHLFWKRASFGETAPTVVRTGTHVVARIMGIANALGAGDPIDTFAGGTDSGTALSIPGLTTSQDNCLVVDMFANHDAGGGNMATGWTNASLTDLTEYGDGSGDHGFGMAAGLMGSAGAVSATTVTLFNTSNVGMIKVALRPS